MEVFLVFAAADTDFVVLRHRTDGLCESFAGHEDAGHKGGGYCAESHYKHA